MQDDQVSHKIPEENVCDIQVWTLDGSTCLESFFKVLTRAHHHHHHKPSLTLGLYIQCTSFTNYTIHNPCEQWVIIIINPRVRVRPSEMAAKDKPNVVLIKM